MEIIQLILLAIIAGCVVSLALDVDKLFEKLDEVIKLLKENP